MGQKRAKPTEEDKARHAAIREQFKHKPTREELLESGEFEELGTMGEYTSLRVLGKEIKTLREGAGLSLTDVSERTGIDKALLSRIENGRNRNPTIETLRRIAKAIGRDLRWQFVPLEETAR